MISLNSISVIRQRRKILDDVTINIVPGSVIALMGENGAGKSTLLRAACGDIKLDGGNVMLAGKSMSAWTSIQRAQMRAVLPQETNVSFMFTAGEVVLMGRSPHCDGYPDTKDREIAQQALARMGVSALEHRLYPTLSGGERARVALARVLAQLWEPTVRDGKVQPRYLLLDEPIAALDVAHQHLALNVARDFAHQQNVAVLTVLHDLNLAAQYADHIVLLKAGRLWAEGSPDEVLTEANIETCFEYRMQRIAHPKTGRPLLFAA
jgi:iron complex transport system ATP-binding protein